MFDINVVAMALRCSPEVFVSTNLNDAVLLPCDAIISC